MKLPPTGRTISAFALLAFLAALAATAQQPAADSPAPGSAARADLPPWSAPPTPRQIQALVMRVTENQHRDDEAMLQFERKERITSHGGGKNPWISERVNVVVPAGIRIVRVQLEQDSVPVNPAFLEQQWQEAAQALVRETHTDDPDVRQNDDREARRARQRYEMVEAIGPAFRFRWIGRTNENGRTLLEFSFEPNPAYRSSAIFATVYAHTEGTVWVDEATCQVARINARLKDDLSIGGGLIAKVYRGAQATLQQDEIAPGTWEPTHYSFDYEGRKFLFSALSGHEQTEASDYRRLGAIEEALAIIRREHPGAAPSTR